MNTKWIMLSLSFLILFSMGSCKKKGCTDSTALNFEEKAKKDDGSCEYCTVIEVDNTKENCTEMIGITQEAKWTTSGSNRVFTGNHIPGHKVGPFPNENNPNSIKGVNETLTMLLNPTQAASKTYVADDKGPKYAFGVALNGVEFDPAAAEAFEGNGGKNFQWTLEATNNNLGLDCNNAHVQPNGEYHYHGTPTEYLNGLNTDGSTMEIVGYAADGFPIYYKYAYSSANDNTSVVNVMSSSYRLKSGDRGGDGKTTPCGEHNGVYVQDYEYVSGLGDLDECNGRNGVTPEFPAGTYYYIITDEFPGIPRCFAGTPSADFKLGK